MSMEIFAISDAGPRPNNEDCAKAWKLGDGSVCLAVADGLGGRGAGGIASTEAVRALMDRVVTCPTKPEELVQIFYQLHDLIIDRQKISEERRFMATTLTAVFLKGNRLIGAHVGDTRAMLARGKGIKKLTSDHSEAQRLLDEGKIDRQQFLNYPRKHILESALGAEARPRIDEIEFDLQKGDKVFVTSDGFHGKLPLRPMLEVSNSAKNPEDFTGKACSVVRQNDPDDNFSVAVAYV